MRILEARHGSRSGRIFVRDAVGQDEHLREVFDQEYEDDEDRCRNVLLRTALGADELTAVAHPGEADQDDVLAVYLVPPWVSPRLFCCEVIPRTRLAKMLMEIPAVFENFTLQVADAELTTASVHAAVVAWACRNYADLTLPRFNIETWDDIVNSPPP